MVVWMLLACRLGTQEDCGSRVWYADVDLDGFGGSDGTPGGCDAPTGHTRTSGDCDDADASVHPGAREVCDGVDEDCDGAVDDDPASAPNWFPDDDGDGWGRDLATATQCSAILGHSTASGDCDDGDASRWPGANEVCDNTVDEDCDGRIDCRIEGDWSTTEASVRVLGENSDEGLWGSGPLRVETSGVFVASFNHIWLFEEPPSDDVYVSAADTVVSMDYADTWLLVNDLDGDGSDDLIVADTRKLGNVVLALPGTAISGAAEDLAFTRYHSALGARIVPGGHSADFFSDGTVDIVLGSGENAAFLTPGEGVGAVEDVAAWSAKATAVTSFGLGLDVGDLDGDGSADVAVGAESYDAGGGASADGAVYVYYDPAPGSVLDVEADVHITGEGFVNLGQHVRVVDDLDGDGTRDLMAASLFGWTIYGGPLVGGSASHRATLFEISGTGVDTDDLDGDGASDLTWDMQSMGQGAIYYGPVADGYHDGSDVPARSSPSRPVTLAV